MHTCVDFIRAHILQYVHRLMAFDSVLSVKYRTIRVHYIHSTSSWEFPEFGIYDHEMSEGTPNTRNSSNTIQKSRDLIRRHQAINCCS